MFYVTTVNQSLCLVVIIMHTEDFVFYTRYIVTYTYIASYVVLLHKATYVLYTCA